jgi:hypothetical protein
MPRALFSLSFRIHSANHDFNDTRPCYSFLHTYPSLRSVIYTSVFNKEGYVGGECLGKLLIYQLSKVETRTKSYCTPAYISLGQ